MSRVRIFRYGFLLGLVLSAKASGATAPTAVVSYGGYANGAEFLAAELQKHDSATLAGATQELWQVRIEQDSLFYRVMTGKSELFSLWLGEFVRVSTEAGSDTAMARLDEFRKSVIDQGHGILSRGSHCKGLDSAIVTALRGASVQRVEGNPPQSMEQASRNAAFWLILWQHRNGSNRIRYAQRLLQILSQNPNEFYDVVGNSQKDFRQFIGSLDETCFLARKKAEIPGLELFRQGLISRLESGIVGNRFKVLNENTVARLKRLVVRGLD
jgi:hypothetical protein